MNSFLWAILTAVIWGVVPLLEKSGLFKIDPIVGLFYRCLGVMIGIVLLFLFKGAEIRQSLGNFHAGMTLLIAGGFLASILGQVFFYQALKTGEASKVVPLAGIYPLVSFILGVMILGEKVTLAKVGGMSLILMGVFLLK